MLDQTRIKDQAPFDITRTSLTEAEEPLLHPVPRRDRTDSSDAIRRLLDPQDRPNAGAGSDHHQAVDYQSGAPDAPEAGPDFVNHPPHYTAHPSGVECIQITRWMNFNLGNAVKYIWRHGDKGAMIEDLRKARWYLDDEIARLEGLANGQG